jgi:hypothetical protein
MTNGVVHVQTFLLLSYVSAPGPLPSPLFRQQVVSLSQSSSVSPVELSDGREGGRGRGAKSYDREKAWPSINHSIHSACVSPASRNQISSHKSQLSIFERLYIQITHYTFLIHQK